MRLCQGFCQGFQLVVMASIIVASLGRAAAPNCFDLTWRQVAFFLSLPGYDLRSIIAEAQGPSIYRELSGPAVFIFDNEHHAVAVHRFTRPRSIKCLALTQNWPVASQSFQKPLNRSGAKAV